VTCALDVAALTLFPLEKTPGGSYISAARTDRFAESSRAAVIQRVALSDDIYASNRLVGLYLAWPGHETKGLRELRRLIDIYPETDVAARARAGLVNLKGQLGIAE
jgi:hypothetical protein